MLEYGGGCPASLVAIAIKKKFAGVKGLVSVSGAMHRNIFVMFLHINKEL